ncbi:MAG: glycosyltransferase, partial [Candidatus Doudnabacteria bacterium]|nr:glycosyltransferase [Candidatus Doudnabacteria bacterium]
NKSERFALKLLSAVWALSVLVFFAWWFNPSHVGTVIGFSVTTAVITWGFAMSAYCLYLVYHMRRIRPDFPTPHNVRVAMIVTKAPSEPLSVVQKTLLGALAQKSTHDTWVADEDPTPEAVHWYSTHGVKLSCRKNAPLYHNETWPRRKKCKEGNLAYFYDNYGYKNYDIVVQLDADHVPAAGYLEEMLKPFSNPKVGYVAAPSVCDNNAAESWASRARLQAEAVFHGPIQSGASNKLAPICIGSHFALRTKALHSIGGIGPELAEDYSTSLLMQVHGWQGAWAYTAEAHGDGPNTFADLMIQDFQWAKSLMVLLLTVFPTVWHKLSLRNKFFFLFTQLWYTTSTLVWLAAFLLPLVALLAGRAPVNVPFTEFLLYTSTPYILMMFQYNFILRRKHMRPHNASFFSWENGLFELARWPWVRLALLSGIWKVLRKSTKPYRVTPKDNQSVSTLPLKIILPYISLSIISAAVLLFRQDNGTLYGYAWFSFVNAASYAFLTLCVIVLHIKEAAKKTTGSDHLRAHSLHIVAAFSLILFLAADLLYK